MARNRHRKKDVREVELRKTPIYWGVPCDELSFSRFWLNFAHNANRMPWDGFIATEGTYLPEARNIIHNEFIESGAEYLMMLDSDILFPPNLLDTLMGHNLPIVGGWYRNKKDNQHPVVYDFISETNGVANFKHRSNAGTGVERVDGMGAGCWLMKKEVALALGENPYDMNNGGEDLKLSRKLMKLEIPLHVDWSLRCAHAGVGVV